MIKMNKMNKKALFLVFVLALQNSSAVFAEDNAAYTEESVVILEDETVSGQAVEALKDDDSSSYDEESIKQADLSEAEEGGEASEASIFESGDGTEENPYQVSSAEDFLEFTAEVNSGNSFSGEYFILTEDIDLTGYEFDGVGAAVTIDGGTYTYAFEGVFDGNGKTISYSIKYDGTVSIASVGLFNYLDGEASVIKNLNVICDIDCRAQRSLGAIVGLAYGGTIENCSVVSGTVLGANNVGGICGYTQDDDGYITIKNCTVEEGVLVANQYTVSGNQSNHIGGILGYAMNNTVIEGCVNYGTVTTDFNTGNGGICGRAFNGTSVINSDNYGEVSGAGQTGGICGNITAHNSGSDEPYGSLTNPSYAKNCTNYGNVLSSGGMAGAIAGLVEMGGYIEDCENKNSSVEKDVATYSIQLRLFKDGISTIGFGDLTLYKDGIEKYSFYECEYDSASVTYESPFYRIVRMSSGDPYLMLFQTVLNDTYDLYIDGEYSGYGFEAACEEIKINMDVNASENEIYVCKSNDIDDVEFILNIPSGVGFAGLKYNGSTLSRNDYSYDSETGEITLYGSFLQSCDLGENKIEIVTDEEGCETLKVKIALYEGVYLIYKNAEFDLNEDSDKHEDVVFEFENPNSSSFISVSVNGTELSDSEYVFDNNTCTISAEYLEGFEEGTYDVEFSFDGEEIVSGYIYVTDSTPSTAEKVLNNIINRKISGGSSGKSYVVGGAKKNESNSVSSENKEEASAADESKGESTEALEDEALNKNVTRGEFARILWDLAGNHVSEAEVSFSDVEADNEYYAAVSWAVENKIIYGYEDNTFRPDDFITREQTAVMIFRYLKIDNEDINIDVLSLYNDSEDISGYALNAAAYLIGQEILVVEDNNICPKDYITYKQINEITERIGVDEE